MGPSRFRIRDADDPADSRARAHSECGVRSGVVGWALPTDSRLPSVVDAHPLAIPATPSECGERRAGCGVVGWALPTDSRLLSVVDAHPLAIPATPSECGVRTSAIVLRHSF